MVCGNKNISIWRGVDRSIVTRSLSFDTVDFNELEQQVQRKEIK